MLQQTGKGIGLDRKVSTGKVFKSYAKSTELTLQSARNTVGSGARNKSALLSTVTDGQDSLRLTAETVS